jgi:hypothetical protein
MRCGEDKRAEVAPAELKNKSGDLGNFKVHVEVYHGAYPRPWKVKSLGFCSVPGA